jgi:hypothetical protein
MTSNNFLVENLESLEEHLYRSYLKKYGLESLAVRRVGILIQACKINDALSPSLSVFNLIYNSHFQKPSERAIIAKVFETVLRIVLDETRHEHLLGSVSPSAPIKSPLISVGADSLRLRGESFVNRREKKFLSSRITSLFVKLFRQVREENDKGDNNLEENS